MIRHSLFRAYVAAAIAIAYALALLLAFGSMCRASTSAEAEYLILLAEVEQSIVSTTAEWQPYTKANYAAALKAGKPIIWRFDSDNCASCVAMHRLHASPKVAKALGDYTLLTTNISRDGSPHKRMKVKATPSELVIDPKRNAIVRRWRGSVKTPAQYFERLLLSTTYPVQRKRFWTGCSNWRHLDTADEHRGKFDSAWLRQLTDDELQELHSDDHEGVVQWQHVVRKETR